MSFPGAINFFNTVTLNTPTILTYSKLVGYLSHTPLTNNSAINLNQNNYAMIYNASSFNLQVSLNLIGSIASDASLDIYVANSQSLSSKKKSFFHTENELSHLQNLKMDVFIPSGDCLVFSITSSNETGLLSTLYVTVESMQLIAQPSPQKDVQKTVPQKDYTKVYIAVGIVILFVIFFGIFLYK